MKNHYEKTKARFDNKYEPIPESGCWVWIMATNETGYGLSCYNGKQIRAHRLSYLLYKGDIPRGMLVCHVCDVPSCVNPDHLFLGTHADNSNDMKAKGRSPRPKMRTGELNHSAKLTRSQVLMIVKDKRVQRIISEEYGVTQNTISEIKRGKTWAAVTQKERDRLARMREKS